MFGRSCGEGRRFDFSGRHGGHGGPSRAGRSSGGGGDGGRRGGPRDMFRTGRMLADGDLRLIALALLAESPRHGYDIIKALGELSSGVYSPSPGVIYPTLTFLEEAGYTTSVAEGTKKVFSITEEGRKHLAESGGIAETALEQIEQFGRRMARAREWFDWRGDGDGQDRREREMPEGMRRLREVRNRLRQALGDALDASAHAQTTVAEILEKAAAAIEEITRRR